jgi:hypothetical protein
MCIDEIPLTILEMINVDPSPRHNNISIIRKESLETNVGVEVENGAVILYKFVDAVIYTIFVICSSHPNNAYAVNPTLLAVIICRFSP